MTTKWTLSFGGDSGGTIYLNANDTPVTGSTTNYLITGVSGTLNGVALTSLVNVGQKLMTVYTIKNQVKTGGLPSYLGVKDAAGNSYLIHAGSDSTVSFVKENDVINFYKTYSAPTVTQSDPFITGTTGNDTLSGSDNVNDSIQGYAGNDSIKGLALNDTLEGGEGNDTIDGGEGNDLIYGGLGNDSITAGPGNDEIDGNEGTDKLVLDGAATDLYTLTYVATSTGGTFTVRLGEEVDLVQNIESIYFAGNKFTMGLIGGTTGNDSLVGATGGDYMVGDAGNDTLNGGAGNDRMIGGAGNDLYIVDSTNDTVEESEDQGTDTVQASATYILGNNVENLTLTGTGNSQGLGNRLGNVMIGNAGSNLIDGGVGNDTIDGGAGNDTIAWSLGYDSIEGGLGNDTVRFSSTITGYEMSYSMSLQRVYVSALSGTTDSYNYWDYYYDIKSIHGVEKLTFRPETGATTGTYNLVLATVDRASLMGTASMDILFGSIEGDTLNGGAGADRLYGFAGDDTYYIDNVGDMIYETFGNGDKVISSITYALTYWIENLTLTGAYHINGTGNDGANTIQGNTGNNVLSGLNGNDIIIGGTGQDTLTGGGGNDYFKFTASSDSSTSKNDTITDFVRGGDKIDLSAIDANTSVASDQAFTYIGAASFSAAGQLRLIDNVLYGDVNGDKVADFKIALTGVTSLESTDFVL